MAYTTEDWCITLESLVDQGSWKSAALAIGCAESTLFATMDKSRKMAKEGAVEHPLFFEWRDQNCWYHVHARRARMYNIQSIESEIRESVKGQNEVCYDPATGRPLLALDPQFIGVSDADMEAAFCSPAIDRFLWERDSDGNRIRPIYQTKKVRGAAALTVKAITGLLPDLYGEKASLDVTHRGAIVHVVEQAKYIPRAQRVEQGVVDGEFSEVPALPAPSRPDIDALRAEAARLMADPNRATARPTAPVDFGTGGRAAADDPRERRTGVTEPAPTDLNNHARAYTAPTPEKRPAYARRPHATPDRANGMKVV